MTMNKTAKVEELKEQHKFWFAFYIVIPVVHLALYYALNSNGSPANAPYVP